MSTFFHQQRSLIFLAALIFLIVLLAVFLHRPIQITDALTTLTADGYEIHVSVWRVLFEPVVGPLLFYLQAPQPLYEFLILMIWLLFGFLVFMLIRIGRLEPQARVTAAGKAFLRWVAMIPVALCIWVALILVMIFAPLPSNTIRNHNPDVVLVNVHSHSHFSHDGLISPTAQMRWHKRNGFDAFFLTEHNNHGKTLEMVKAQKEGNVPPSPLVLCGREFSGSNHILLLGLTRNFSTKDVADSTAIDSAHAQNGVAIVAHWFSDMKHPMHQYIQAGADGFEIVNQGEGRHYDRSVFQAITETCKAHGLTMVGACDYHGYGSACLTWNALNIPHWRQMSYEQKYQSILNVFRQRDRSKIQVLVYEDRPPVDSRWVFFSPIYTLVNYFRGLNGWQISVWIVWIFFGWLIAQSTWLLRAKDFARRHYLRALGMMTLPSAAWITLMGVWLLFKSIGVRGYNEIFTEFGIDFLIGGAIFLAYSLVLLLFPKFKRQD